MSIIRHNPHGGILSDAVEHGGLVWVAGTVADDLTQYITGQTKQVLASIDGALARPGRTSRRSSGRTCGSPTSAIARA
jgi:enamine deaminase RidA (YjgF/YER057c/UK114 family)